MLSKSAARNLFLAITVGFSAVFLWLTVDSIAQVPARSHEDKMDAAVVRGKEIWETNNCMGCHTLLGEGAYYAPELTQAYTRRGEEWLRVFLKDPEAMYPGKRKMINYGFSDDQITDVIAFLKWIGEIDTNGFPAAPDMALQPVKVAVTADGQPAGGAPPAYFTSVCMGCHALGGKGGVVGPALDGVGSRFDQQRLDTWLRDPQAIKPGTAMPNLALTDDVRQELVTFLMEQK